MYTLDLEQVFYNLINNLDSFTEDELEKELQNLYKQISLPKEFINCSDVRIKILNTIKDIVLLYKEKNVSVKKRIDNYLRGYNPTNLVNYSYSSPNNSLKLGLDDYEIIKYDIMGEIGSTNLEINISKIFYYSNSLTKFDENEKLTGIEENITFKRTGLSSNELYYTYTTTRYIDSIIKEICTKNYKLENVLVENYQKLGINDITDIIYNEIKKKKIKPLHTLIISRCDKYPDYVEVTKDNQMFLTTFNIENGINSLDHFNEPLNGTITRVGGNIYTAYIFSKNKINSKGKELVDYLQNDDDKNNFQKYYKYVNKTL